MKKKISVIYFLALNFEKRLIKILEKKFNLIKLSKISDLLKKKNFFVKVEAIICHQSIYYNKDVLKNFINLKYLVSNTTSNSFIDLQYCRKHKIKVITLANKTKILKKITPTAEHTIGLMISITRNYLSAINSIENKLWNRYPYAGNKMLSRSCVGIVGNGRLGKMVKKILLSFGSNVLMADIKDNNFRNQLKKIEDLADIVSIHIPVKNNKNFISQKNFKPKKKIYMINTSRGEVINEKEIIKKLKSGKILGYATDVLDNEFSENFKIEKNIIFKNRNKFNIIITPHIGGSTIDAWSETQEIVLKEFFRKLD